MSTASLDWIDRRYFVTEDGHVYSTAGSNGGVSKSAPRRLKVNINSSGYAQVRLFYEGRWRWFLVARLVLRAFTGVDGPQANHKDGNRTHNALRNLEWVTGSENMHHAFRCLGRKPPRAMLGRFGERNPHRVPVVQKKQDGTLVRVWPALQEAARAGYSAGNISAVCRGLRSQHKGFIWNYAE